MRRRLLPALAVLAFALVAPMGPATAFQGGDQGRESSAAPIRVIQHNTDHVPEAWQFALERIESADPDVVMIQEVCLPWFTELQDAKPEWTMAFHPRKRHYGNSRNPGCHGDFIGEAVIYTGAPGRVTLTPDYPNNNADGLEKFGMACVEFQHRGVPTLGCSTHLSAYPTSGGRGTQPERDAQVQSIMDHTAPYREAGWAVVLGGDFNMTSQADNANQAPDMNLLMGPEVGGTGAFYDASQHVCECRLTQPDSNRRIDYVFFDGGRTPWTSPTTITYADSPAGHHLLEATAPLYREQPTGR